MFLLGALGLIGTGLSGLVYMGATAEAARSFALVTLFASFALVVAAAMAGDAAESPPERGGSVRRLGKIVLGTVLATTFLPWIALVSGIVVVMSVVALFFLPLVLFWTGEEAPAAHGGPPVPRPILQHA